MRKSSLGLSLIELMIGMAIGLVIVAATITVYTQQAKSYRQLEALSRLQENARYAFEIMGYDLRLAGNWTCHNPGQTGPANVLSNPAGAWWSNAGRPLFGVPEAADANAAGDAGFTASLNDANVGGNALRGDAVVVLRADHDDTARTVQVYDLGAGVITVDSAGLVSGDLLVLTDCRNQTVVFQATADADADGTTVEHAGGGAPTPGNCKADLMGTGACPVAPPGATNMAGGRIYKLLAHTYYVRNSPRRYANSVVAIPSLYRQVLSKGAGGNITTAAEELVDGVIDMRVLYGEDTSAPLDGAIDTYVAAGAVTNWSNVLAVRVTLTLETIEDNLATSNAVHTYFNGVNAAANRKLRKQFTATFGIRGRLN